MFKILANAINIENPAGIFLRGLNQRGQILDILVHKACQAEEDFEMPHKLQPAPAVGHGLERSREVVRGNDHFHQQSDFCRVSAGRQDSERGKKPALQTAPDARPAQKVARTVGRRARREGSRKKIIQKV